MGNSPRIHMNTKLCILLLALCVAFIYALPAHEDIWEESTQTFDPANVEENRKASDELFDKMGKLIYGYVTGGRGDDPARTNKRTLINRLSKTANWCSNGDCEKLAAGKVLL